MFDIGVPFLRCFTALVTEENYNDVRFLTEPDENVWWYDGQRVEFRTPNYARIHGTSRNEKTAKSS